MKSIINYMRRYCAESRHPWFFLTAAAFTGCSLAVNYSIDLERSVVSGVGGGWMLFPFYCLFFGFPFFAMSASYSFWYRKADFWKRPGFYLLAAVVVGGLSLEASTDIGAGNAPACVPAGYAFYFSLCMNNVLQALLWSLPPLAYWHFMDCTGSGHKGFRCIRISA